MRAMARFSWPWSKPERFSTWSIGDPAFAAWLRGDEAGDSEVVTPRTVLGLSAVLRAVSVISTTIASLPLRTYERQGDERARVTSVFDDPYPGIDGMTRFAWVETILIHLLLWREAFLWHEDRDRTGFVSAYRPIIPDAFGSVERKGGRRIFSYTDPDTNEKREVDSDWVTYIPGPSLDGVKGHPMLVSARNVFSGALSGDRAAARTLRQGIRIAGLVTPAEGVDIPAEEGEAILENLRPSLLGNDNAGGIAFINRSLKLDPWTPTNEQSQWHQTKTEVNGEVGRIFGLPPHLLNDTEKQTSWGTGVAEQNLGLARYTLMGWSSRIEQILTLRLPADQFVEFDYKGLLQGTPADEIRLVIEQVEAGLMDLDYACRVLNLPAPTPEQKAAQAAPPAPRPIPLPQEAIA